MSTRVGAVALAGVAALAAALSAGPATAAAATTWTVRPGGAITAHSGNLKLTDTTTGATLTCSSTVSGTLSRAAGCRGPASDRSRRRPSTAPHRSDCSG